MGGAVADFWFGFQRGRSRSWTTAIGRNASRPAAARCLEIGFGAGEVIGELAKSHLHIDYLGVEVHRAGVGRLLLRAEQTKLTNLRVVCHDAVEVLAQPGWAMAPSRLQSWFSFPTRGTRNAIISGA